MGEGTALDAVRGEIDALARSTLQSITLSTLLRQAGLEDPPL